MTVNVDCSLRTLSVDCRWSATQNAGAPVVLPVRWSK